MIFFCSILIIYFNIYIFLSKRLVHFEKNVITLSNLKYSYSFVILIGIIGIFGSISFYLDFRVQYSIFGIVFCAFISSYYLFVNRNLIERIEIKNSVFSFYEKLLFWLIIYLFLTYFHRALAPWSDLDEISAYGYRTKLIGTGFTYSDNIVKGWPQFAEAAFSYFYYSFGSTIFVKICKFLGLLSITTILSEFFRLCAIPRIWSLVGILIFLITPEFSYMATSLKTDITLMMFEISGIVIMLITIKYRLKFKKNEVLFLTFLGTFLCMFALGVRTSAFFSFSICSIYYVYILSSYKNFRLIMFYLFLVFFASFFVLTSYWINLYEFQNPLYPLYGSWMKFYPDGKFISFWEISNLRTLYNIDLGNTFLEYFYVLLYSSLGFGTTLWDNFPNIVHPLDKGVSIGWANPILLSMLFLPFISRNRDKTFTAALIIFYSLYTFWFFGVQYTRTFLAGTTLLIICFICLSSNLRNVTVKRFLLSVSLVLIIVFSSYHTAYTIKRMPNTFETLYSEEARFDSNQKYYNFMNMNFNPDYIDIKLSHNQITRINNYLSKINKPIIYSDIPHEIHMFFKYGQFIKDSDLEWNCALVTQDYTDYSQENFSFFLKSSNYVFYCP